MVSKIIQECNDFLFGLLDSLAYMNRIDGILFDLDGTLLDTRLHTIDCIKHALSQNKLSFEVERIATAINKSSLREVFQDILGNIDETLLNNCLSAYHYYQNAQIFEQTATISLYPGIVDTLSQLNNHKLAVVTGKPRRLANDILTMKGLSKYFITVVGVDDVPRNKPFPDMLELALYNLGYPKCPLIVGDSATDILAGKASRILTCAVEYGYTDKTELKKSNPDFWISQFADLLLLL